MGKNKINSDYNPPNWRSSICGVITSSTQFNTIPSNAFANIGVSEIGRMSFSSEPGGCFLGTGTRVAVFQRSGSLPSLSELLKIAVTGAEQVCIIVHHPRRDVVRTGCLGDSSYVILMRKTR